MSMVEGLRWPDDWKRHKGGRDTTSRFQPRHGSLTILGALTSLYEELERLRARDVTVTTNLKLKVDGRPIAKQPKLDDPGVSIFFSRAGVPHVMAQDRFDRVEGNLRSLALAVKAMRDLERHGGGVIAEKAFEGFTGVPATTSSEARSSRWWEVLGVSASAPLSAIRGAWKEQTSAAQKANDMDRAKALNAAWDEAQAAVRARGVA